MATKAAVDDFVVERRLRPIYGNTFFKLFFCVISYMNENVFISIQPI